MLLLVGMGLDVGEITLKALEAIEECDLLFYEDYTSSVDPLMTLDIESRTGKTPVRLERKDMEEGAARIVEMAKEQRIVILVPGDPLSATTHVSLLAEAKKAGVSFGIVHAPSILTSVGETGLQLYKFGRTVTVPAEGELKSVKENIVQNLKAGLHTLVLLDIGLEARQAIKRLGLGDMKIAVVARANRETQKIFYGPASKLAREDFGEPPHCIAIPGKLHFMEEEVLKWYEV